VNPSVNEPSGHVPVLLDEVLERLSPSAGEVHVDGTLGLGGHAERVLSRLGPTGLLIGIDRDAEALEIARPRLDATGCPYRIARGSFAEIPRFLRSFGLSPEGAMDGLLLDLGLSSLQLDKPQRGFSFLRDGPLDMRMSAGEGETATELLERLSVEELEGVLREYGEEPAARRIARAIDTARRKEPIRTTGRLARIVESVLARGAGRIHPATRTFQAIRICLNRELESLQVVLKDLDRWLKPAGRVVVLSYHSLEDRLVKQRFREGIREGYFREVFRNPARPGPEEVQRNPRARSAKLRSVVRCKPMEGVPSGGEP